MSINILGSFFQDIFDKIWSVIFSRNAIIIYVVIILILLAILIVRVLAIQNTDDKVSKSLNKNENSEMIKNEIDKI